MKLDWAPAWVVIIIVCRELVVTGLRAIAIDEGIVLAADKFGKAKTVLMGIHEYERMQETLAMLKALSLSGKSFEAGKGRPARDVFAGLRAKGKR